MKKRIRSSDFLLVLFAVAVLSAWQVTRQRDNHLPSNHLPGNSLVGRWEDEGSEVTFHADGTLDVVYKDRKCGRRSGAYRVDFSKHPAELDFQVGSHGETRFVICEVSPNGVLRMSRIASNPEGRYRTFDRSSTVMHRQS